MDTILDGIFHGLFSAVDPLGMVLRTLMALLADALAQVSTGMYSSLFEVTTIDLQQAAVSNIWQITTGLSASLATILLMVSIPVLGKWIFRSRADKVSAASTSWGN